MFLVTKKRVTKLKMTEFDENFSEDHMEGTEVRISFSHHTHFYMYTVKPLIFKPRLKLGLP